MRKSYDQNTSSVPGASKEVPYAGFLEIAHSKEPSHAKITSMKLVSTLLVEPNTLLREGLKRILAETAYNLAASTASLDEINGVWKADGRPLLLIIDGTSDHDDTCRQIRQFKDQHASARVAMLVDGYDLKQVIAAYQAGADAYLMKSVSCEVLVKTLDLVMLGEAVFPSAVLGLMRDSTPGDAANEDEPGPEEHNGPTEDKLQPKGLSVRETVILRCLMEGDSNKLIARKFDITEATVKVHVKAILRKIRAKNRTQAAIWAANHLPANGRAPTS
jgi:two-component system, NarL family, nitrate/nitrite response regulator NarL